MKKYNIAFIPKKISKDVINLVQTEDVVSKEYLIGENSIPHVTVCQFYLDEDKLNDVVGSIEANVISSIELRFKKYSHITFNDRDYWISLLPDYNEELMEVYQTIINYVKPIREDVYDPHLTLFNYNPEESSIAKKKCIELLETGIDIKDEFYLAVCDCDEYGQISKIIKILASETVYRIGL